ncbi:hypothetical protein COV05_04300 [Candidatus Uhrbacteria bacterium CG10_big_fil_rev_8_21_14_0_10_48_16]|uniref:Peptidase S8/S53 domain-containing protein n=1 Tax=Candidatus Uhrbacteria bacterium CG10_big_fil_rev_8_21_14_0_10_48_16 TaxID=1975038 RepID=A0A2M8LGI1_9BACT|nr:MAG: hypothetical protein COV05_04300 [Candidatus Uhrbacteria bacterium CG10_big_fil_rev_8_21_14_0_10_48_16]
MQVERPLFQIPQENIRTDSKTGGGKPPKYIGEKSDFEHHKLQRVQELDRIFSIISTDEPSIAGPDNSLFFEVEFHEEALSKSVQPRKLLEASNIDVYSQRGERKFFASATEENLQSFRDSVSGLTLSDNKHDAAYLSAVTSIDPISREDKLVLDLGEETEMKAFLYFADTLSINECKVVHAMIERQDGVSSSNFFVAESGAKVVYGKFSRSFVDAISDPDPRIPIDKIERAVDFVFPQSIAFDCDFNDIELRDLTGNAVVGVVDSGIAGNDLISPFLLGSSATTGNLSHGTFVASRTIYGNNIEHQIRTDNTLIAYAKVVDLPVMKNGSGDPKDIISAMKDFLENPDNAHVRVFNLSLNSENPADVLAGKKSFFTRELDALAHKHKVLFIVSAGNHDTAKMLPFPACMLNEISRITSPADSLSAITVGSVTDAASTRSIALFNEPSPFSRVGSAEIYKPDVTHYGGNLDTYFGCAGIGVNGCDIQNGKISESVGTSFSAPLVSQIAARLYDYLEATNRDKRFLTDLTKALVIHSAVYELPDDSGIKKEDVSRMVGFGIPDFSRSISCAKSEATFIHTGSIGQSVEIKDKEIKKTKHKIRVVVPESLVGKDKKIRVRGTLVYTPPISVSGDVDYSLVDVACNLYFINGKGNKSSAQLSSGTENYRSKWNPVKHFEKTFTAYSGGEWEVWLTLTTRGSLDDEIHVQDYALILTVEDVTSDPSQRIDLHSLIKAEHREYVSIESRARIQVQ